MKLKSYKTKQDLLNDLKCGDILIILFYENDNESIESFEIFTKQTIRHEKELSFNLFTIKHTDNPFYNLKSWNLYLNQNFKYIRKVVL